MMQKIKLIYLVISGLLAALFSACSPAQSPSTAAALQVADLLSRHHPTVVADTRLFLTDRAAYLAKYRDPTDENALDFEAESLDLLLMLTESLYRQQLLVLVDWKEQAHLVFDALDHNSGNRLSQTADCQALRARLAGSQYNINFFLQHDADKPSLFDCSLTAQRRLVALDLNSDTYALLHINPSDSEALARAAKAVGLGVDFFLQSPKPLPAQPVQH